MVKSRIARITDPLITHGLLVLASVIAVFPVLYTFMTSFKTAGGVLTRPPTFFPQTWSLDGYQRVLFESRMLRHYLPNTVINASISSLIVVTLAALAAYTFSRYRFRGSRALEVVILGVMMMPALTFIVPYYRAASDLDLLGTHQFIISVYVAWGLPFAVWIVRAFIDSIPIEVEEAALIDGCTPVQALWFVVLPLAMPGMLAAFLMVFVESWNEFLLAVVLLTGDSRTATVGLYDFQSQYEIEYHVWTAACIVIMTPVLAIFLLLRRRFFEAMLNGAIKG